MTGSEIVKVCVGGSLYTASAAATVVECARMFGEVSGTTLAQYGVECEAMRHALVQAYRLGFSEPSKFIQARRVSA